MKKQKYILHYLNIKYIVDLKKLSVLYITNLYSRLQMTLSIDICKSGSASHTIFKSKHCNYSLKINIVLQCATVL